MRLCIVGLALLEDHYVMHSFVCFLPDYTRSEPLTPAFEMGRQLDLQSQGKTPSLSYAGNLMLGDKEY